MPKWELTLAVDAALAQPLFLQIARGIADGIKGGRLRPGQKLPGTRALA
ncbi:MAG: GntR family transcriptional regulator, partial [Cyanobacteria bacterium RYN_339]|nr:GntR family transcriptional regulator [Cyanobacteria bacterium RYN_339]